jgi:hypothetical protein
MLSVIAPKRLLSSSNSEWKRLLLFDLFLLSFAMVCGYLALAGLVLTLLFLRA